MVRAMCENEAFTDITDIYACIVNLVEHSYGYDSCEILLTDTQVVHLMAPLTDGDYDTDQDNLLDRQELSHEENVNISNLLEAYIKYNKLPEEEANKLRANPYIKMWAYKSNPALPDTDFDGRNDDFDFHRPLENRQVGKMSTLNYEEVNFDYNQDYRYFFMPSTQYYYELSEMSMVLANMVNKKSGTNRRWNKDTLYVNKIANDSGGITQDEYRETFNANGIAGYMNYIGLDDIEEYDMSNTVGDPNVCQYVIGHRDVVYALGRTQNVMRNVIAISIGDIESKAAELYANFDGHAGREGNYTEYHHIGFDVVANRILEVLERYASRYAPEYQKVFWITGEGGGGSVANLLAQKMIKKYGNKNIYCYTFQALNTINCNALAINQMISNEPYYGIFNLYNDDNQILQVYTNKVNFYMYGIKKHVPVSSNETYKRKWQESTGIRYPVTTKNETIDKFLDIVFFRSNMDGIISAFFNTDQELAIRELLEKLKKTKANRPKDLIEVEKAAIALVSYFASLTDGILEFDNAMDQSAYDNYMMQMQAELDNKYVSATKESSGLSHVNDDNQGDVGIGGNQNSNSENIEDADPRDGKKFDEYNLESYKSLCTLDNKENEGCVRIGDFAYSNYTLPKSVSHYDIDYSKFWNENYTNDGSKLFEYKMGDIGKHTKFTYTSYSDATTTKGKELLLDKNNDGTFKTFGNGLISMDDRIVAYFPIPVYSKGGEDISFMHKFNNYYDESINEGKYHGFNGKGGLKEDTNTDLNLVDVVFEKYDNNGAKHQFVVPFIVGGTKWLHQSKQKKMYSMFTDNRYGQITEDITNPDLNSRVLKGYANYYYKDGYTDVAKEKKLQNSELGTMTFVGFAETPSEGITKTIDNTYPSYKDTRIPINCSPIEPVKYGGDSDVTTDLINQVFSDQSTCIVSMRVYDLDVEEQIGENNSKNWKKNINQDLPYYREHNGDFNFKYGEAYFVNGNDDNHIEMNIIVKYPSINNSE